MENSPETPTNTGLNGVPEVPTGFKPTSTSGTSQSDHIPTVLDHSPNRERNDILSKETLTPKVIRILERDGERLDWAIAKELDQPSALIEEVLSEVGIVTCKRMFGDMYRVKPEFLNTA